MDTVVLLEERYVLALSSAVVIRASLLSTLRDVVDFCTFSLRLGVTGEDSAAAAGSGATPSSPALSSDGTSGMGIGNPNSAWWGLGGLGSSAFLFSSITWYS